MNRTNGWQFVHKEPLTEEQRIARMTELLFGPPLPADNIARFVKSDPEDTTTGTELESTPPSEPDFPPED